MAVKPLVFQPAEEAAQFGPDDRLVLQPGKQHLDGIEHHPLRLDRIDRIAQPDEKSFEVVLAGLLDLAALDENVVDCEFAVFLQLFEIVAKRCDVLR